MRICLLACGILFVGAAAGATSAQAASVAELGARLERYDYPMPVHTFSVVHQGQSLQMTYMDVVPPRPNGQSIVLLHGKNFCGPYWLPTAKRLSDQGYRVVIPDQIGFCKSSKPRDIQYNLQQLAADTHSLLTSLGIGQATVVAHSMGGMIGIRMALMYPQATRELVLVDPLGLEDWRAKGIPWRSVDDWYKSELKTTAESIKAYQQKNYYGGEWKADYDPWVALQAGMYAGGGRETAAWAGALTYDMIYSQPVVYELPQIRVPTVLIIGQRDTTAIGREGAPAEVAQAVGNYPALGKQAAAAIPGGRLIELDGLGHAPMLQAPERFNAALDDALGRGKSK